MEQNPRDELLQRFRQALKRPVVERYFDEDELVELYDYAGDLNDDYIQMEVLFCGARLYPDSAALSERRALLYLDTTIDDTDTPSPAAALYLADNPEVASPLFDIIRLETNHPDDVRGALDFLLSQYDTFGDEEVVRLIELASELGEFQWVKDNLAILRTKVSYLPGLLYEVMCEADERMDDEVVIMLAEELIEVEPFQPGYWITLFRAQARAGRQDDARNTFDSARALATDNPEALMMLAEGVYMSAPYLYDEALEILDGLIAEYPDEFRYTDCRCALYLRAGKADRAVTSLKDFIDAHPTHEAAMRQLVGLNVRDVRRYIDRFYGMTGGEGFSEDTLNELVSVLSLNNSSEAVDALLINACNPAECDPMQFSSWIEALYELGEYERLTIMVDSYPFLDTVLAAIIKGNAVIYSHVVALMKLGRQADADAFIARVSPMLEEAICEAPMPVRLSIRALFTLFDKIRRHPASEKFYWEVFDSLRYGKFR